MYIFNCLDDFVEYESRRFGPLVTFDWTMFSQLVKNSYEPEKKAKETFRNISSFIPFV
jgi:hypothetical protein